MLVPSLPTDTTNTDYLEDVGSLAPNRYLYKELLFSSDVGQKRVCSTVRASLTSNVG
jgi:hypothetical protein